PSRSARSNSLRDIPTSLQIADLLENTDAIPLLSQTQRQTKRRYGNGFNRLDREQQADSAFRTTQVREFFGETEKMSRSQFFTEAFDALSAGRFLFSLRVSSGADSDAVNVTNFAILAEC